MTFEITPTNRELLAIIALLWTENDSLRERLGGGTCGIHFNTRTFSNEELVRGGEIAPKAVVQASGSIVVSMES